MTLDGLSSGSFLGISIPSKQLQGYYILQGHPLAGLCLQKSQTQRRI